MAVGILTVALGGAAAQTALVAGGLTALPVVKLGADQIKNGGFETLSGGLPGNWGGGGSWAMDQLITHSGTYSYRWSTGSPSSDQPILLKRGAYKLSGWVKTQSVGSGIAGIRLQMDFRPGGVNQWFTTEAIQGTTDWKLYEIKNIVVTQDIQAAVRLENYAGASGTAWFDDIKVEEQLPQLVDVFMLYPNYRGMLFDDQPQTMRFDVTVTPPGNDFSRYSVKATLADEGTSEVLLTRTYPASANFVAELDGSLMQLGRPYQVTFALVDGSTSAAAYTYPGYRVSKAPGASRQSMNMSFDDQNRILVKGTPRFILGVYDSGLGYSADPAFWENVLWSPTGERRMNGLRINMYLNYWYGEAPADAMNALMANLQQHGATYLQTGNCFDKFAAGTNFGINNSDPYVQSLGSQGGSAGYYVIDECQSFLIPGAFDQYKRLRDLDPDSVTFAALLGNPDVMLWRDAADVLSTDPYPMYGAEPSGGYNHKQVADWTALTRDSVKNARPYLTVLQFFKFTSLGRFPTFQEMRNHAYMAIVEGAKGLFWWSLGTAALQDVCSGWCGEKTAYMNNLKTLVGELADLEPVLLAPDAPGALTANGNPTAIRTKVKVVAGKGYVFAYNYTNQSVTTTLIWNTAPETVTVNAENRTVATSGSSFTDTFAPYQAHVYVIGNGGTGGTDGSGGSTTGPTVSFANPQSGATLSGTAAVTMNATGGTAPYSYTLAVDGTNVYTGTNNTFSLNTATLSAGEHTLTASVTDSSSPAKTGTASRTVTVSTTTGTPPPSTGTLKVAITAPANGTAVSGTNWAIVWVSGASGTNNTYKLRVGNQEFGSKATASTGPVDLPWDTTKVANGTQQMTATVTDATGNTGSANVSVTVSNAGTPPPAAPTLAFTSPANGATVSGITNVAVTASGGSGGYTYALKLDNASIATSNTYSWNTTSAANGSHTLTATVTDSAGATASATATVTVSNTGTTPPPPSSTGALQVSVTQPTNGATVSGTNWATLWVSGASGTANTYKLSVGGQQVASQTVNSTGPVTLAWDTTKVAGGTQQMTASVTDATGKTGSTTLSINVSNNGTTKPPPSSSTLTAAFISPANGATVSGTTTVGMSASGAAAGTTVFTLAVDNVVMSTQSVNGTTASYAWNTTTNGSGTHYLTLTVRDAVGKTATASRQVTVSNTTSTSGTLASIFTSPLNGSTVSGGVAVNVWVEGQKGTSNTFTLLVDGKVAGTTTVSNTHGYFFWASNSVGNGTHTLTVRVKDATGNTGAGSVTVRVRN